jgi:hypothetical protein
MNIFVDTTLPPTRNLVASVSNPRIVEPKPIFYGDKLPVAIHPTDGVGSLIDWAGISTLTIAIGDLLTGEQYVVEQSTTFDGFSYNTTLDLDINAIALATLLEESVQVTFEIQANHNNGDVETIHQGTYDLRNQFLYAQSVTNTAPATPSDLQTEIAVLPIPATPSDLDVNQTPETPDYIIVTKLVTPTAPSEVNATWARPLAPNEIMVNVQPTAPNQLNVQIIPLPYVPSDLQTALITPARPSSVRGQMVAQSVPLPPSEIIVSFETAPDAPTEVLTYCYKAPRAPDWVFVNVATQGVTDVQAQLLTPLSVTQLNVTDLLTIEPDAPLLNNVQTIPLEPSAVARDSSPRAPIQIETDISPVEPNILSVVDYANRPAGMFPFSGPSNMDTRIVYGAGDPNGDVPSEVNAVLYNNRPAGFPSAQFGITNLETELVTPRAPTQLVTARISNISTTSMVSIGDMHGEVLRGDGGIIKQGTYFTITLDSSGSMNAIFPAVEAGAIKLRDYARVLYYGGNVTSAQKYIRNPLKKGNEDWIAFLQNFNQNDAIELVFINESQSIYHTSNGNETATVSSRVAQYRNYVNTKTSNGLVQRGYVVGYGFGGSWGHVSTAFKNHLNSVVYTRDNLQAHGVDAFFDYQSNAGTDATTQFLINYLRIPQNPSDLNPQIFTYQNALHSHQWVFSFSDYIQGKTGTFDASQSDNILYTQAGWDLEISLDDGTTILHTIQMGNTLPTNGIVTPQTHTDLVGQSEIKARLVARGISGVASKYSNWVLSKRLCATPSDLQTTII